MTDNFKIVSYKREHGDQMIEFGLNDKLINLAKKHGLILIEDCCESHGATYKDKKIGSYGDMSCFSFYFGHHMTTIEGGMVCTNDESIYE